MFTTLIVLTLFAVAIHVTMSILIVNQLQMRKVPINFFLLRLYLPKYAHQYKKITLQETGKVGGLFYGWLISISAALVFGIALVAAKALS